MWFNIYEHFFFYKIYENCDVISQKVLTSLQKWSHWTNFVIVLCIKSELIMLIFQLLTNYVKDFWRGVQWAHPSTSLPQPINIKKVQPLSS